MPIIVKNRQANIMSDPETQVAVMTGVAQTEPIKFKESDKEIITHAVVHFRPTDSWKGEFGMDYLRIEDEGCLPNYEKPYKDIIESGFSLTLRDKNGAIRDMTPQEAYEQLKTQYHKNIIQKKPAENGNEVNETYYVPYITLFSEVFVDQLKKDRPDIAEYPKFEADLQLLVEVDEDEIDKIEIDFNEDYFAVNKVILDDKLKSPLHKAEILKLKCKKDLPQDMEIKVYAYPKNSKDTNSRKLAGRLIIVANNKSVRKSENILLVGVKSDVYKTNIKENFNPGIFKDEAKYMLHKFLYQFLIIPKIIQKKEIDREQSLLTIDITQNTDFQIGGSFIDKFGFFKTENTEGVGELVRIFINENKELENLNATIVFSTQINPEGTELGITEFVGKKHILLFPPYKSETLSHEVLHGLGLFHTQRDLEEPIIKYQNKKYLFKFKETANIMSYSEIRYYSWRWQWNIINKNISEI